MPQARGSHGQVALLVGAVCVESGPEPCAWYQAAYGAHGSSSSEKVDIL